jgi:RNA recognition motif-containing protein
MGKKLYVGNLSYDTTSSDLQQLFGQHGTVQSAEVIQDRETGRSKGFGFVEMGSDDEAQAAISALSGQQHAGRALTVNEAKPKTGGGGGGGGGRSGGGYGGGGGRWWLRRRWRRWWSLRRRPLRRRRPWQSLLSDPVRSKLNFNPRWRFPQRNRHRLLLRSSLWSYLVVGRK